MSGLQRAQDRAIRVARTTLPPSIRKQLRVLRRFVRSRRRGTATTAGTTATTAAPAESRLDEIDRLERGLWDGYHGAAVRALSSIADESEPADDRASAAAALAQWYAATGRDEPALEHLERVSTAHGALDDASVALRADCLIRLGRGKEARRALVSAEPGPDTAIRIGYARALIEPDEGHGSGPVIEALSRQYLERHFARLTRADVTRPVQIDNLRADASRREPFDLSPTVSIVVPVFDDSEHVEASIDSLLAQTWPAPEIVIVIGKSSSTSMSDRVEQLAGRHPRIRVISTDTCLTAASARATGVDGSVGEFVMIHGASEWSHPQRVDALAGYLIADPQIVAVGSHHIRTTPDLLPAAINGRPEIDVVVRNTASMMLRREVLEHVGTWDDVARGSDDEFVSRVEATWGKKAIAWVDADTPLSITVAAPRSASDAMVDHALSPGRLYRRAYRAWHESDGFASDLPYRPNTDNRPFTAPARLLRDGPETQRFDVIYAGDLGADTSFTDAVRSSIRSEPGRSVGLVDVPGFDRSPTPAEGSVAGLVDLGADLIGCDDDVACGRLVIGPSLMMSPVFDHLPAITADEVVAVAPIDDSGAQAEPASPEVWPRPTRTVNLVHDEPGAVPWQ